MLCASLKVYKKLYFTFNSTFTIYGYMAYMYNLTIMLETDVKYHLLDNLGSSGEARSHGSRGVYSSRRYIYLPRRIELSNSI